MQSKLVLRRVLEFTWLILMKHAAVNHMHCAHRVDGGGREEANITVTMVAGALSGEDRPTKAD